MSLLAPAAPQVTAAPTPGMSPTSVAALILLALIIDYMSIGPGSIRDRIAFFMALPAIRVGFRDSPLTAYTTNLLGQWIDAAKTAAHGAYLAQAATNTLIGMAVGILTIYCVGVLLPVTAAAKFGAFARLSFSRSGSEFGGKAGVVLRINWKLWTCAFLLGVLADLPRGLVGGMLRGGIDTLTHVVAFVPNLLFGT